LLGLGEEQDAAEPLGQQLEEFITRERPKGHTVLDVGMLIVSPKA